ncbi:hypothetical protein Kpol_1067p14 [Vanderwaltozyma polyspora DSM 70294]|uniref:Protein kinase domain-containing protein n=1 Tax=Vanderwaltozyma polyspora (strain ATCC 22028 / DSM 70294 / BCRC 21397 / CBS 2163 / NBRC 10782 / NRRL Y-8283 / UCD 57-17) TaxID=436907 RepID=A7TNV9_VANPO|nr:uncharacterized protein Kpol_1067p14 [Vanderwaltozyma polyspora DSM 70294]EDO16042.1 hypothetical protein Kpol_1067p14 [Vanderwaltozyma polyspora DSM 70294]
MLLSAGPASLEQCKYVIDKHFLPLGDGHFSVVRRCKNVFTQEVYAMKIVDKATISNKTQLIKREIAVLQKIDRLIRASESNTATIASDEGNDGTGETIFYGHHHVLQLFDFFETLENIILITQLCSPMDLYEKIVDNNVLNLKKQVIPYTACILSALEFLHSNGLIHRDVKAENILFRNCHREDSNIPSSYDLTAHDIILADFGLASESTVSGIIDDNNDKNHVLKEYVGTISYISPEIVKCQHVSSMTDEQTAQLEPYNTPVDIWALGVLTYFMVFGYTPFDCEGDEETLDCIRTCDYYIDQDRIDDPNLVEFWDFLRCCFQMDPCERPSATELKSHSFLSSFFSNTKTELQKEKMSKTPIKSYSSSSLHSLKLPTKAISGTTLSSLTTLDSLCVRTSSLSLVDGNSSSTLTISSKQPSLWSMHNTKQFKAMKKTLSMTTMKPRNGPKPPVGGIKKFSTFKLDPNPPRYTLMNGCLSTNPESKSDFHTTPRSLSRESSINSILSNESTHKLVNNFTSAVISRCQPSSKPLFEMGYDEEDDDSSN